MDLSLGPFYSRVFLAIFSHSQAIFSSMNGDGMELNAQLVLCNTPIMQQHNRIDNAHIMAR